MSVVVKGMEMPKDFFRCPFAAVGTSIFQTTCRAKNWNICSGVGIGDCPLVELPKHGRMIDADALKNDLLYDVSKDTEYLKTSLSDNERENIQFDKDCKQNCASYVSDAPTVLEADE